MKRIFVFLIISAMLIISSNSSGGTVGVTSLCQNLQCYTVASSSIISTALGISALIFIAVYRQKNMKMDINNSVGILQRLGALFIDFFVMLMALTPLVVLPILWVEAQITGTFAWSFARPFVRPSDAMIILPGVLLIFVALFFYFYLHARKNRATIGQYLFGFKISASESGTPNYLARTFLSLIGICAWPISIFLALRRQDRKFWWEIKTHTRAVRMISDT